MFSIYECERRTVDWLHMFLAEAPSRVAYPNIGGIHCALTLKFWWEPVRPSRLDWGHTLPALSWIWRWLICAPVRLNKHQAALKAPSSRLVYSYIPYLKHLHLFLFCNNSYSKIYKSYCYVFSSIFCGDCIFIWELRPSVQSTGCPYYVTIRSQSKPDLDQPYPLYATVLWF